MGIGLTLATSISAGNDKDQPQVGDPAAQPENDLNTADSIAEAQRITQNPEQETHDPEAKDAIEKAELIVRQAQEIQKKEKKLPAEKNIPAAHYSPAIVIPKEISVEEVERQQLICALQQQTKFTLDATHHTALDRDVAHDILANADITRLRADLMSVRAVFEHDHVGLDPVPDEALMHGMPWAEGLHPDIVPNCAVKKEHHHGHPLPPLPCSGNKHD